MNQMKRFAQSKAFPYIAAFGLPFFICVIICIGNGVYPFGDNCILHIDMYHQYCPFFTEFLNKLQSQRQPASIPGILDWDLILFRCMPTIWQVR